MKKLIALFVVLAFLAPALGHTFESMKKGVKPEKDKEGGYTSTQTDYKSRLYKQNEEKQKGGYHGGGFHNKSPEFKQEKYQFIKSAGSEQKKAKKKP